MQEVVTLIGLIGRDSAERVTRRRYRQIRCAMARRIGAHRDHRAHRRYMATSAIALFGLILTIWAILAENGLIALVGTCMLITAFIRTCMGK